MIRPRRAWPLYERFLRNVAGLGRVDPHGERSGRYETEHRRVDVLVVGGGEAGSQAAAAAAAEGHSVVVVDTMPRTREHRLRDDPGTALGVYEGGLVPVAAGELLYRFRAGRIVVAAGSVEQPLVFPGNDLAGVMLPSAVARLVDEWSLRPGERAVVVSADDRGLEAVDALARAGTNVARVVDLRAAPIARLSAAGRRGRLRRVTIDGRGCGVRPARHVRRSTAGVLTPGAGRGARRVRRRARGLRAARPSCRHRGGRDGRRSATRGTAPTRLRREGEVLCLHLRGRDDEGHPARARRRVRLDRARQAVHDGDDGPLPGQALPAAVGPVLRGRARRRRGGDRHDDGAAAMAAGDARTARRARA